MTRKGKGHIEVEGVEGYFSCERCGGELRPFSSSGPNFTYRCENCGFERTYHWVPDLDPESASYVAWGRAVFGWKSNPPGLREALALRHIVPEFSGLTTRQILERIDRMSSWIVEGVHMERAEVLKKVASKYGLSFSFDVYR